MSLEEWQETAEVLGKEFDELLVIARELAAKHMRGNQCCTACGAAPYMQSWTHADGCPVKKLEVFQ